MGMSLGLLYSNMLLHISMSPAGAFERSSGIEMCGTMRCAAAPFASMHMLPSKCAHNSFELLFAIGFDDRCIGQLALQVIPSPLVKWT